MTEVLLLLECAIEPAGRAGSLWITGIRHRDRTDQWRVALVVPTRGPADMYAQPCAAAAAFAAREINTRGGVCGREVTVDIVDGSAAPQLVGAHIDGLLESGLIDAVTGWHSLSVRNAVARAATGRIPFVYSGLQAAGADLPGVYNEGPTLGRILLRPLEWLRDNAGIRRWYFVGSYGPSTRYCLTATRRYARELGLDLAGGTLVAPGADMLPAVERTAASGADAVLVGLIGRDAVAYNKAFGRLGVHTSMLRFEPAADESVLAASHLRNTRGIVSVGGYFDSAAEPGWRDLRDRYNTGGPSSVPLPALTWMADLCYEGVLAVTAIANAGAGGSGTAGRITYDSPQGTVELLDGTAWPQLYIATSVGTTFDVVDRL